MNNLPYTVLAELTTTQKGKRRIRELKQKAIELGADAIIIMESSGFRVTFSSALTSPFGINSLEKTGWKALAIKYK